jgi:hypothetical protein
MTALAALALASLLASQSSTTAPSGGQAGPQGGPRDTPLGAPAPTRGATAEPAFDDGNFVGFSFAALGKGAVDRVDNITILCAEGIDRARRRLREGGAPVRLANQTGRFVDAATAAKMADALDGLMVARRAEVEDVGVQLSYSERLQRARVQWHCEAGPISDMGLKREDAILSVGGRTIKGRESAAVALKYLDEDPVTALLVLRDKQELTLDTTAHQRGVRALLVAMSRRLKMVPDPADPSSINVAPAAP